MLSFRTFLVQLLNESTSLLSATCDTFIQTLDDCVKMAHSKVDATLTESHSVCAR